MFDRLKRVLVESYIGTIALGYLFASVIIHFVDIFASPIAKWLSRKQYGGLLPGNTSLPGFSLADALPDLARFIVLLVVWYVLLRWLYFKPLKRDTTDPSGETSHLSSH